MTTHVSATPQLRRKIVLVNDEQVHLAAGRLGQPEVDFSPVSEAAAISLLTQLTRESFSLAGIDAPDARFPSSGWRHC